MVVIYFVYILCADRTPDESIVKVIVAKLRKKQKTGQTNDNDSHPDRADAEDTEDVVMGLQEDEETESIAMQMMNPVWMSQK